MSNAPNNPYQPSYLPPSQPAGPPPSGLASLSAVDWLLIVLCSGIGCIIGIIRLIQGKPSGGPMLGFSILFMFIWTIVRVVLTAAMQAANQ
jgi:hypothetical protein